jgi:hypothetical protein
MTIDMPELTIGEMIKQVPEGQTRRFDRSVADSGEERYFRVWQNWDYRPGRLEWLNSRTGVDSPWLGSRKKERIPVSTLPPPDVIFRGPAKQVVDFYSTGSDAYFVSDKLFRLIDDVDPGSLEHLSFGLRAKDEVLPFHAVMPRRVLEAIDQRRTAVLIQDERLGSRFSRKVRFPDGILFDNASLEGVASFSDLDSPGWYWSKDLIAQAQLNGIRGLYAESVATPTSRQVARL